MNDEVIGKKWWEEEPLPQKVPVFCYCGSLAWTERQYGQVTHKHGCPARTDDFCQSHPEGCPSERTG